MERYVKKIVDLMIAESLFSWQGGPIILLQVYEISYPESLIRISVLQ